SIHLNVIRPFPEAAVIAALAGKKNVIILERTDEAMAGDNPMGRDIRTALNKALRTPAHPASDGLPAITIDQMPQLFSGIYGLGSRDFRPEHVIGAYEFVTGARARKDGKRADGGTTFFVLGVDHPYEVKSDDAPSLLPEHAIAVRFHSIGGWGAITTGKNLGAILGDLNDLLYERDKVVDELGNPKEIIHVSANPKYGSEKKGAPTSYFMVAAPERIRATDRADLQLRMQGNAFLGAFFAVSPLLEEFRITQDQFREVVRRQYVKKFGRLGESVVNSNMEVMTQGFERVREIRVGELQAPDRSTLRGKPFLPVVEDGNGHGCGCRSNPIPDGQAARTPVTQVATFDGEFRSGLGYNQPASALASVGVMAAGSGDTASKYVARRETPLYIAENCTQCMECIAVCPDTALPNCSQDLETVLRTAVTNYVTDAGERQKMFKSLPEIEKRTRDLMREAVAKNALTPLPALIREVTNVVDGFSPEAKSQ